MKDLIIYKFNEQPIKEEFIGALVNFFKGLWKKMAAEIAKLDNDPNKIKDYIINNTLNSASKNSVFNNQFAKFKQNNPLTDEVIFNFIDEILNKNTGVLGVQGIGNLFNDPSLKGDKMKGKRIAFEYIINTARDYITKKIKYDQKKNIERKPDNTFVDANYLEGLKKIIPNPKDLKMNDISTWIDTNIFKDMQNFAKSIREDDIKAAMAKGGITAGTGGEVFSSYGWKTWEEGKDKQVYYQRDGWDANKKAEEQGNLMAVGKITNVINDPNAANQLTIFNDNIKKEIFKKFDQIVSKEIGDKVSAIKIAGASGDEQKLKDSLGKLKAEPAKIGKVLSYTNFIQDPANADKAAQIDNIINQK
jgi:hypothetical protein